MDMVKSVHTSKPKVKAISKYAMNRWHRCIWIRLPRKANAPSNSFYLYIDGRRAPASPNHQNWPTDLASLFRLQLACLLRRRRARRHHRAMPWVSSLVFEAQWPGNDVRRGLLGDCALPGRAAGAVDALVPAVDLLAVAARGCHAR